MIPPVHFFLAEPCVGCNRRHHETTRHLRLHTHGNI